MKKNYILWVLTAVFMLLSWAPDAGAQLKRYYVKAGSSGAAAAATGSWTNACGDLQAVLDVANSGDTVFVAAGVYNGGFYMKDGVQVYGGFKTNGSEMEYAVRTNPVDAAAANLTGCSVLDGEDSKRVLTQPKNFGVPTVWDGFVVCNGWAAKGAGAYLLKNGVLRRCIVRDNHGSGVYASAGARVEGCVVEDNTALSNAGVYLEGRGIDKAVLTSSTVVNNKQQLVSPTYKVGDVYPKEATGAAVIGIVFWVDETSKHGWVVNLKDQSGTFHWSANPHNIQDITLAPNFLTALADTAGWQNTQKILSTYPTNEINNYAANQVDVSNGWYLPAAGQLRKLHAALPEVNPTLTALTVTYASPVSGLTYWSSSVSGGSNAWYIDFIAGTLGHYLNVHNSCYVRSVRAF